MAFIKCFKCDAEISSGAKLTSPKSLWFSARRQLPIMLNGMESGELKIPKDVDVRSDLAAFRVINGVPKLPDARGKEAENKPRHGDTGIAIPMAYGAAKAGDSLDYLRDGLGTGAAGKSFGSGGGAGGGIWGVRGAPTSTNRRAEIATIEEMQVEQDSIDLRGGSHGARAAGTCAMEAAALVSGRRRSDHDDTICPVVGVFIREW